MRRSVVISAVVALGAFTFPVASALAASPASSSVAVPTTVGQTRTVTWTGTIPPGANPTSDCNGSPTPSDVEDIAISVPANAYNTVSASFAFSIHWTPVSGNETTNDEILTVVGPNGAEVGSSDTSNTTETVTANDIQAGTYHVQACGFVNVGTQTYSGSLVIKTTKPNSETSLPAAPAN